MKFETYKMEDALEEEFSKIMIDIPDISTKRKITSNMERLDEKNKTNNEINDNLPYTIC